jgi:hypothetical protein
MDETHQALDEARHWVRVSLLQVRRFVASFQNVAEAEVRDATEVSADGHFLLNACAQAENAMKRVGRPLAPGSATTIRALRDVHEHWEQHKKSFESKHNPKSRAGARFTGAHPDHLPRAVKIDATGTQISALRLEDLWDELIAIERDLVHASNEHAEQVGAPLIPEPPDHGDFPRRDSNVLGMAVVTQNMVIDFESSDAGE